MNIGGGFLDNLIFSKFWGGILNIEGGFLNIGGFLDNLIFSKNFFKFFVLEAKQSLQTASGVPWVATRCPFLVPPREVHPTSRVRPNSKPV